MQTPIKSGDTLETISRQLQFDSAPFDYSDLRWELYWTCRNADGMVPQFIRRPFTAYSRVNGDPVEGIAVIPLFTGATTAGARTAPVTVAASEAVRVTLPASADPACTAQRVYATHANDPGGVLYFCAEGPNGFAAAGVVVANDDAVMVAPAPADDESATNGNASLGMPGAVTSAVPEAATAGMTVGDHEFAIVNVSTPDSVPARMTLFEIEVWDSVLLRGRTWPENGFEELLFTPTLD